MMSARNAQRRRTAKAVTASLLAGVSALALAAAPAQAITANFGFSPATPRADATTHQGDQVSFTSSSAPSANGGTITSQTWDFGDGGSGSGGSPTHTFTAPGAKPVKLTVNGSSGGLTPVAESATMTKTVTVAANQPPIAGFRVTPTVPTAGSAVTFTSTARDPDGTIPTQSWDLNNDGTFGDATAKAAKRTFTAAGTFTVGLQVTDDLGRVTTTTQQFRINAPPAASIGTPSPAKPIAGDAVTFRSTSTDSDGTIASTAWDLDHDGIYNDATGATAQRTFTTAGTFTVGVLVTDNDGATNATTITITVVPNQKPAAGFSYTPTNPATGAQMTFTSSSKDPDGSIASTVWDLDNDGQFNDGRGATARRTFNQPGSYTVSVRVTDDRGGTDTAFEMISVVSASGSFTSGSATPAVLSPKDTKLRLLNPFPVITLRGRLVSGGARIEGLVVTQLPKNARVEVRCSGKGCPFKSKVHRPRGKSRSVRFPELVRRLRAGIEVRVIVSQPGRVGKYTSFTIRKSGAPIRKDLCMVPGAKKPRGCTTA